NARGVARRPRVESARPHLWRRRAAPRPQAPRHRPPRHALIDTGDEPMARIRNKGRLAAALVCAVLAGGRGVAPAGPEEPRASASLAGQLLVATPEMPDPRFARTVIYMIQHDASGAEGVVVNRPLGDIPLATLLKQMRMDSAGVTATVQLHA